MGKFTYAAMGENTKFNGEVDWSVRLDGKTIGRIRKVMDGWTYCPGGLLKWRGEAFETIEECKRSIEGR